MTFFPFSYFSVFRLLNICSIVQLSDNWYNLLLDIVRSCFHSFQFILSLSFLVYAGICNCFLSLNFEWNTEYLIIIHATMFSFIKVIKLKKNKIKLIEKRFRSHVNVGYFFIIFYNKIRWYTSKNTNVSLHKDV